MNTASNHTTDPADCREAHVVFLVNFVAPNLVAVCQEVASRIGRFTVLSSVAMESNRDWDSDWGDLDVIVQKTWTMTRNPKHPGGYREVNYIHIPTDTIRQLRRLRPDAIVSLELGARTAMSSVYRWMNRKCAHVVSVYASERSESGRGAVRALTRRQLLRRADWVTYNGPSCRRLLVSLGANPETMSPWNYAADPQKPYRGELIQKQNRSGLRLLTVGQLTDRKGIMPATEQLRAWASENPHVNVQWNVLGSGPLENAMRAEVFPSNLELVLHGHCDANAIQQHYRENDLMLFPTLGDEWGLVVDEALFSGLPVVGSLHSQAVTTLVDDSVNGMIYDPENPTSLSGALNRYLALSEDERQQIPPACRESVATRTPSASAEQLVQAIGYAIATRQGSAASTTIAPTNAAPDDATSSNAIQSLRAPVDGLSPTNETATE